MKYIPSLVRCHRQALGLSLEALAGKAGVSKAILVKLENNQTNPQWGTLEKVFAALDIPLWRAVLEEASDDIIPQLAEILRTTFRTGNLDLSKDTKLEGSFDLKFAKEMCLVINQEFDGGFDLLMKKRLDRECDLILEKGSRDESIPQSLDLANSQRIIKIIKLLGLIVKGIDRPSDPRLDDMDEEERELVKNWL